MRTQLMLIALLGASATAVAQPATTQPTTTPLVTADMTGTEVIDLWPAEALKGWATTQPEAVQERVDPATGRRDRRVTDVLIPSLTRFSPADAKQPLAAVIVIPGGGYSGEVFDREGYFVAEKLRAHGIAAFVLKYRLPQSSAPKADETPPPIADVLRAVRLLRADAAKYGIDPHRIGVMGFSAGGHVAGSAATQFDAGDANAGDPVARISSRPDFAVLMYAVSSMHESVAHAGSRKRLLGENPTPALEDRFSTAQRITRNTPPLFLVHAKDDKVVKIANSEEVAAAAKVAGVPCEFIVYETGGHGFGLARPGIEPDGWIDRFFDWLDKTK